MMPGMPGGVHRVQVTATGYDFYYYDRVEVEVPARSAPAQVGIELEVLRPLRRPKKNSRVSPTALCHC